jgi:hypothetical protein
MTTTTAMPRPRPRDRFITDEHGRRVAAVVDIERYRELLDAAEEIEDLRAFDEATASNDPVIPFEEAVRDIESARKK